MQMRFWEIHAGHVDQEHRELTLKAIGKLIQDTPGSEEILTEAFLCANEAWDLFWQRSFSNSTSTGLRVQQVELL
jgi:hypothetical protein